ncbi:aldo/keto reductase [Actinoplanes sp. NEAU-A12]|uniref:Aldo/keto reductase n=1 Tax=Actinoplanes sandaracinus TaxID=3045177 RepID=A0ABT6WYK7_9ACTN|nr:aldo/keto reductase [Actinoplanes sandaracinus]MDI6104830.1 aldo/keto reductase [Actinoplanes sandaracinus]
MTERGMILGAMYFGTRLDETSSMRLLDRFVDQGGTWIDTANNYAFWADPSGAAGQSEALIGRWLAARPGMRDRVRISTKVRYRPTVPGRWPESAEGLSAPVIRQAVQDSLKRLGTDRIDLYWAHGEDRTVTLEETVVAFGDLVRDGTVARLGASNHATWYVERARQLARQQGVEGFTALQLRWSYVQPRPGAVLPDQGHRLLTPEALDYARSEPGLAVWAYTPLINGAYTRADRPLPEAYRHPGTERRLVALAEVAQQLGVTRNQVVLAWMATGNPAVTPIVGVSTAAQLDEALRADRITLSDNQRRHLDEAH